MKISTKNFLYQGSHFLPRVRPESVHNALRKFEDGEPIPIAIAKSMGEISKEYFLLYCKDKERFNFEYQVQTEDVEIYYAGFEIPLHIICNSNTKALNKSGVNFDPISTSYIANACLKFKDSIAKTTTENYLPIAIKVFDYCLLKPLTTDDFYEIGIIASQTVFREIALQLGVT